MIKKVITIIVAISLVLCSGLTVLAEGKTVYIELSGQEGKTNEFCPKVGFDWQINYNWEFAASHQFKVNAGNESKTDLEIRREFLDQELYWALKYGNSESYDSIGLGVNATIPLNDSLSYDGAANYTAYLGHRNNPDNVDYYLLEIMSGFQYQINNKLFTLINGDWSTYQYVNNAASATPTSNYSKLELSAGLGCQFNDNFSIKGVYNWAATQYPDPKSNENWGEFIFSANYTFKKYTFYLEYPFYQKDHTATIGVSYAF